MEIWKEIKGYKGYQISNFGKAKSAKKILRACKDGDGYESIALYRNGKRKTAFIHRLVADAFTALAQNAN